MRIHGDKVITRSRQIKPKSDYHAYLPELQEDFKHICGYCGKSEAVAKNAFEIDHFVPEKYAKTGKMIIQIWYIPVLNVIGKSRINGFLKIRIFSL